MANSEIAYHPLVYVRWSAHALNESIDTSLKMLRTRVKICGITRLEDALTAVRAGADALGFVFYKPSPRFVPPEQAREIIRELPAFVTPVGLFVDHSGQAVQEITKMSGIRLAQYHGEETPAFCDAQAIPYIKAVRVRDETVLEAAWNRYPLAQAILADAWVEGVPGGTGKTFDWGCIREVYRDRLVLAGGLTPANVGDAIRTCRPYAVDVSGGVEKARGIKDRHAIYAFMNEVQSAKQD